MHSNELLAYNPVTFNLRGWIGHVRGFLLVIVCLFTFRKHPYASRTSPSYFRPMAFTPLDVAGATLPLVVKQINTKIRVQKRLAHHQPDLTRDIH